MFNIFDNTLKNVGLKLLVRRDENVKKNWFCILVVNVKYVGITNAKELCNFIMLTLPKKSLVLLKEEIVRVGK